MGHALRGGTGPATTPDECCSYCGSPDLFTVRCEHGPHFARTGCRACGRHLKWEPRPMDRASALDYRWPLPKHRGKRLGDVLQADPEYVRWAAENLDLRGGLKRALDAVLGGEGET